MQAILSAKSLFNARFRFLTGNYPSSRYQRHSFVNVNFQYHYFSALISDVSSDKDINNYLAAWISNLVFSDWGFLSENEIGM